MSLPSPRARQLETSIESEPDQILCKVPAASNRLIVPVLPAERQAAITMRLDRSGKGATLDDIAHAIPAWLVEGGRISDKCAVVTDCLESARNVPKNLRSTRCLQAIAADCFEPGDIALRVKTENCPDTSNIVLKF